MDSKNVTINNIVKLKQISEGVEGLTILYNNFGRKIPQHIYFDYNDKTHEEIMDELSKGKYVLEKVASIFLSRQQMVDLNKKSEGIDDYVNNLIKSLDKTNYKRTKLVVNVYYTHKGQPRVGTYGNFVKKYEPERRENESNQAF